MKHIKAFLVKLLFIEAIFSAILIPTTTTSWAEVLWLGGITTLALYLAGDMMVLPVFGNIFAVVGDIGIAMIMVGMIPPYTGLGQVDYLTPLFIGVAVGIFEFYYHEYLQDAILPGGPTRAR